MEPPHGNLDKVTQPKMTRMIPKVGLSECRKKCSRRGLGIARCRIG